MRGLEKVVTLLSHRLVRGQARHRRTGRVHEGDGVIGVDRHDRRGNGVEVLDLLVGGLPLPHLVGDVEDILQRPLDVALGVLDRGAGVANGHDHALFRPGDGLFGHHRVGLHRPGAGTFFGLAVRGLEKVVTLLSHRLVRGQARHRRTGRVHEGDGVIGVDRHDRRGNGVEVLDLLVGGLPLPHLVGDVEDILQCALDVALGVLDRRAGVPDRHDHTIPRSGDGLLADHRIALHRPGTGAFLGLAVRSFEEVVTLLPHDLIRGQPCHRRTGRIHVGNGKLGIDLHDRGGNDVQVRLHLSQTGLHLLDRADIVHDDHGSLLVRQGGRPREVPLGRPAGVGTKFLAARRLVQTLHLGHRTVLGAAEMTGADLLAGDLAQHLVLFQTEFLKKCLVGPGDDPVAIHQIPGLVHQGKKFGVQYDALPVSGCHSPSPVDLSSSVRRRPAFTVIPTNGS